MKCAVFGGLWKLAVQKNKPAANGCATNHTTILSEQSMPCLELAKYDASMVLSVFYHFHIGALGAAVQDLSWKILQPGTLPPWIASETPQAAKVAHNRAVVGPKTRTNVASVANHEHNSIFNVSFSKIYQQANIKIISVFLSCDISGQKNHRPRLLKSVHLFGLQQRFEVLACELWQM